MGGYKSDFFVWAKGSGDEILKRKGTRNKSRCRRERKRYRWGRVRGAIGYGSSPFRKSESAGAIASADGENIKDGIKCGSGNVC
jgi:hypothetical protein